MNEIVALNLQDTETVSISANPLMTSTRQYYMSLGLETPNDVWSVA